MSIVAFFFTFLLGTIIGSFLNVVILRYAKVGISGRSQCTHCQRVLTWYELIPVLSFFFLKGKCRTCRKPISLQYVVVETLNGLSFLFIALKFSFPENLLEIGLFWALWSILLVIAVYDFHYKTVPDPFSFLFAVIAFGSIFFHTPPSALFVFPQALVLLAGPILFFPFFLLWFVSQGRWIGLGDGKLAIGIGFLLGLERGVSALIIAFWIGAAVALTLMILSRFSFSSRMISLLFPKKRLTMKSELPFAPFLIVATALVFFLDISVISL